MGPGKKSATAICAVVLLAAIAIAGCGGSGGTTTTSSAPATTTSGGEEASGTQGETAATGEGGEGESELWSVPNADLENTRSISSPIEASNVKELGVKWRFPLTGGGTYGKFASTPVFGPEGNVFIQDLAYSVYALDAETGGIKWEHKLPPEKKKSKDGIPQPIDAGPNGLTLYEGVAYATNGMEVFAFEAETGKQLWRSTALTNFTGQGLEIAPAATDGKLYVGASSKVGGAEVFALDVEDGEILWSFNTTKTAKDRKNPFYATLGSGGVWNTPAVAPNGLTYWGIANPYLTLQEAKEEPTPFLYNNSTVALDAETGKLKWYYQGAPNDFYDWDMQLSPIYVEEGTGGEPTVYDGGKMGYVYAMNAETGKLLWKTPVGKHSGNDEDGRLLLAGKPIKEKYPKIVYPGYNGGVETNLAYSEGVVYAPANNLYAKWKDAQSAPGELQNVNDGSGDFVAIDAETGRILWDTKLPSSPYGAATVTNDLVFTTTYEGKLYGFDKKSGKIVWEEQLPAGSNAPIAISDGLLIAGAGVAQGKGQTAELVAYELGAPGTEKLMPASLETGEEEGEEGTASVAEGKEVFSTNCATCHTLANAGSKGTVGPNLDELEPSDALVQKQVTDGGGGMPAYGGQLSKTEIESVAEYVSTVAGSKAH